MKYETVIGLEVHVQLSTRTKLFCGCTTRFGESPNTQTCPVCLGLPGSLPVLNEQAFLRGIRVGLALNGNIAETAKFDRKNYFYPDLPKAYQISQYDKPISKGGYLNIDQGKGTKRIGITRAHLEEDAGKLVHMEESGRSRIDYNRAGTPLLEIVSEPDLSSPEEATCYLTRLKAILLYLEVSDCNMEEGSLRCDANVSIRPAGSKELGTKTELKNLNSFKAVEKALTYEVTRHTEVLESGGKLTQETRLWDEKQGITKLMRSKEEAHDYRYFPEPDLVPFRVSREKVEAIRKGLPELPEERRQRFISEYGLTEYDSGVLIADKSLSEFFEACCRIYSHPKKISNWVTGPVLAQMNARNQIIGDLSLNPEGLAKLLKLIEEKVLSNNMAKEEVFPEMLKTGQGPEEIVKQKGLKQVSDEGALRKAVEEAVQKNPKSVEDYMKGRKQAIGFLVGQVMKQTKGAANPQLVNQLLEDVLSSKKGNAS
jgi:aspartyl-tRNA(Asn)/glutamyl-tRNA(Gln) amidotransferase subunit B